MISKPPRPQKPLSNEEAEELMCHELDIEGKIKEDDLSDFMEKQGYKWSRLENMWIDDGSLALAWADAYRDAMKDKRLEK